MQSTAEGHLAEKALINHHSGMDGHEFRI